MGTRSITVIKDEEGKPLLTLYRQMDGHFYSHGKELFDFISGGEMVDGYTMDQQYQFGKFFNGMGDFACQLMAHLKKPEHKWDPTAPDYKGELTQRIGSFYILPSTGKHAEEYNYEIGIRNGKLYLKGQGYSDISEKDTRIKMFPNPSLMVKKLMKIEK